MRHFYSPHQDYLIFISHQEQQPAFPALSVSTPLGSTGTTPPDTRMSTPFSVTAPHLLMGSSHTGSPFKDKIIASLGIPVELADHKEVNLCYAWQKYKAYSAAVKTCNMLWDSGKLREAFDQKPMQVDLISIFKGKSQWHLMYTKAFPKLSGPPTMVSWLEDSDDKLSDIELWGVLKPAHAFSHLLEWLVNGGEGLTKGKTEAGSDMEKKKKKKKRERSNWWKKEEI